MRRARAWSATTSSSRLLVITAEQPASRRQQLDLRPPGDEALALVEHVAAVLCVRRHDGDADRGASMQVEVTGLGCGDVEASPQLCDDRPHDGSLLLQ